MAHGRVHLTGGEMIKFRTIKDIIEGTISQKEGAKKLELSTRQVRRLQGKVSSHGVEGIVHGLLGRPSNNSLRKDIRDKIISLWKDKYKECELNFTHYTEKLNEVEGVKVSKDTVRTLLRKEKQVETKPRKRRKHRKERPRKERVGELLQQDTSPHDWLSTGEQKHLVVIQDDATSEAFFAKLYDADGTLPNLEAMDYVFRKFGLPRAMYTDGASWFHYSEQGRKIQSTHKALREGRDGKKGETQIGRALKAIGVELIRAGSPQAKGRVERVNRTFQDRLISELRLENITDMDLANEFIKNIYLPDHNKRFAKDPADFTSAFAKLANPESLTDVLCLRFQSCVRNDNVVSKAKYYSLQLLPGTHRYSWTKAWVDVRLHLDGSVTVRHAKTQELIPFEIKYLNHAAKEYKHGRSMVAA